MRRLPMRGVCAFLLAGGALLLSGECGSCWAAPKPNPPITSRYTVKGFVGGTKTLVLSLYPPLTFADSTPIPAGAKFEVRIRRSYDGGKTYGPKGVTMVSQRFIDFRDPETGQTRFDPARISWIECTVETPVDPPQSGSITLLDVPAVGKTAKQETTVWLCASVVVNGVESAATNRYLTFRYAVGGIPGLVRYETPDTSGQAVPTSLSRAPVFVLADRQGNWPGTYMLTAITVSEEFRKSPEFRQQGCQEALAQFERAKGKETPLTIRVTSIKPDSMTTMTTKRGKDGAPVATPVPFYPGTATITMSTVSDPKQSQTFKADLVYYQHRSCVVLTAATEQGSLEMIGDLLENATHYEIHGPFRFKAAAKGKEIAILHGMWLVRRPK